MEATERVFVLHCFDPDLRPIVMGLLAELGIEKTAICFNPAGGCKDLAAPTLDSDTGYIMRQVHLAVELGATHVIVLNHTDCRAYQKAFGQFPSKEKEEALHKKHMEKSEAIIRAVYPRLTFEHRLARLERASAERPTSVEFVTVKPRPQNEMVPVAV
ncbi:MAG: hypothetical protein U1C57_00130 [Candidatus Doudnabacteria bacterium]|nr:hypothetical protein [bacterium]MDZ4243498.1 hypothetical protein [Candidatus Doudnabacteria bacterium]